MLIEQDNWILS